MRLRLKPLTFSNLMRTLPYHYKHSSARSNALYDHLLAAENSGELDAMRAALDEFNHAAEGTGVHAIEGVSKRTGREDNLYLYVSRQYTPYAQMPTLVYDLDRGTFGIGRISQATQKIVLRQETHALMRRASGRGGYNPRDARSRSVLYGQPGDIFIKFVPEGVNHGRFVPLTPADSGALRLCLGEHWKGSFVEGDYDAVLEAVSAQGFTLVTFDSRWD